jgi:putative DNA modification/repair radical SAM protein
MQTTLQKLAVLADAAKYDASCASSGTDKKSSLKTKGIGSTEGMGICHAYAPDGRCISLLKILLTNYCRFDCHYCVNRVSSNVPRARFTVDEVVDLTMGFYKRNYIEGLFLSSGIIQSPDYTMEQVVAVARKLRLEQKFSGYIHLKTIPDADPALLLEAGRYADRLSINVELPQEESLKRLAPEKDAGRIRQAMGGMRIRIEDAKAERKENRKAPRFAPAGQSTQMIIGADAADDTSILRASSTMYSSYKLTRVYYSAFSPIPDSSRILPLIKPPLMREHRLYQADWLLRFYGFGVEEIIGVHEGGMLDLHVDPKTAWALQNRQWYPVDVNTADRERLLRVPGLGAKAIGKILGSRRWRRLRLEDLARLCHSVKKVMPFITCADWHPGGLTESAGLKAAVAPVRQLELFS